MGFKEYFFQFCNWLDNKYWGLPKKKRRIAGWCVLLSCIGFIYFGGYLCYRGGKGLGQLCQSIFFTIVDGEEQEEENKQEENNHENN